MQQTGTGSGRNKPSYLYAIISVALVLLMIGLIGVLLINANKISNSLRENVEVSLILKDRASESEALKLQAQLKDRLYVKSSEYVSKDKALELFQSEYEDDFESLLGFNPLFASINVNLNAAYANQDSLLIIEHELNKNPLVEEVYYQRRLVEIINANIRRFGLVLVGLGVLFLLIAITLIDSTIKLAMFSNRFLIKSMQMVGATRWFISKPFLFKSLLNGFLSGIFASGLLILIIYFVDNNLPSSAIMEGFRQYLIVCGVIILLGIIISWWSTRTAVLKYLKLKLDDLY